NKLLSSDPKDRLSPEQALEHPFIKERLLSDEKAKEVVKGVNKPPEPKSDRAGIAVTVTPGLTDDAFRKSLEDAIKSGALVNPGASKPPPGSQPSGAIDIGSTATMIVAALAKLTEHEGKFAKPTIKEQLADAGGHAKAGNVALDIVVKGVDNLLKKPDYSGHPTIKGYLEKLKTEAQSKRGAFKANRTVVPVTVTNGLTGAAFKKTL